MSGAMLGTAYWKGVGKSLTNAKTIPMSGLKKVQVGMSVEGLLPMSG